MSLTTKQVHLNGGKLSIDGSFDLDASAAVLTISNPDGSTKTVRGQAMSCVKATTGTYTVTVKLASSLDGQPVFQPVEVLFTDSSLFGATTATALFSRVTAVAKDSNGNIAITVITADATGAAVDTTHAITVTFKVDIDYARMDPVI